MVILVEDKLIEMAKIIDLRMIPDQLDRRARGAVHDGWFWSQSVEDKQDFRKIALKYSLSAGFNESLDFYYGFIRPYAYKSGGSAKASGAPSNPKWAFAALRLESNVTGAEGKWGSTNFEDSDFEKIWRYEDKVSKLNSQTIQEVIKDFKLKSWPSGNILNMCQSLLTKC